MKRIIPAIAALFCVFKLAAQPAWQQHVDTRIDVTLDDKKHMLYAFEEITYKNNSKDTLRYIYMHLWPNAYKNDRTPFEKQLDQNHDKSFYYSKPKDKGYIDSLQFTIDGTATDYYSADKSPDIARIDLLTPLLPGNSIKISTPFKVKIPKVFSRLGHTGQAYYISQWFPKPAVYDEKGWHPISYLDLGEFYSEYGSYDVSITLPANYVVMATGNCLDEKENAWLDALAAKPLPTEKYGKKNRCKADSTVASSSEFKTIHFHEDKIHDFAWFADKRWLVRKDTVYTPGTNQLVTAWTAFPPCYTKTWEKSTEYLKETIKHYGKWVGPYQYKTIKAVCGDLKAGGGMEYPTVTVIDKFSSSQLRMVITHEAGHNWFYGMLGSNERDHAWMDEGINTFYEQKTTKELEKDKKQSKKKKLDEAAVYFQRAATGGDQAIEQTSANFEKLNYGLDIYFKTAMGLRWLEQYMGEKEFEAGMKEYFDTWHFHHPYPEDFMRCMQKHATKSIAWFYESVLHTDKKIDFTITSAKINGSNTDVTVRNNSNIYAPVLINSLIKDSITSSAWSAPFARTATLSLAGNNWTRLKIGDVIPDGKPANDVYKRNALFHRFGLKIKPFVGLNLDNKYRVFVSPAAGYNQYDGIMAGALVHNLTLPENRFRFIVAPLYSFQTSSFAGAASLGYVWYSKGLFKEIMLQADAKTFHDNEVFDPLTNKHLFTAYTKIAPSLNFIFNEHNMLSPVVNMLSLKGYRITEEHFDTTLAFVLLGKPFPVIQKDEDKYYGALSFEHYNTRTYNPYSYSVGYQMGADFAKVNVQGMLKIDYNKSNRFLLVRAYFGKFFAINNTAYVIAKYELNATYSGMNDYLYDGTYIGRNTQSNAASQQISQQEGGFKVPTLNNAARSDNWMGTINLSSSLPLKRWPIRLFFDAGLISNANPSFTRSGSTTLLYDGGVTVSLRILNYGVTVNIPLIMSRDFDNYLTNSYGKSNVFARSISFSLHLQNNWLRTPSTLLSAVAN